MLLTIDQLISNYLATELNRPEGAAILLPCWEGLSGSGAEGVVGRP